jgi:molybdate transport system substrate-binding protein
LYLIVSFCAFSFSLNSHSEHLRIAVASNFIETARQLSQEFEKQNHTLSLISGSSGKLFLQITKGAPFDVFLSADSDKPKELVRLGFAEPQSLKTYANGQLGLWLKSCIHPPSDQSNRLLDIESDKLANKLRSSSKLAIANPTVAPYGMASEYFLRRAGLWQTMQPKLVYPENISQVAQLAKIGVVDAAIVAISQRELLLTPVSNPSNCILELSADDYPKISQQMVILSASKNQKTAEEFVKFLSSEKAQTLIKNMGYN